MENVQIDWVGKNTLHLDSKVTFLDEMNWLRWLRHQFPKAKEQLKYITNCRTDGGPLVCNKMALGVQRKAKVFYICITNFMIVSKKDKFRTPPQQGLKGSTQNLCYNTIWRENPNSLFSQCLYWGWDERESYVLDQLLSASLLKSRFRDLIPIGTNVQEKSRKRPDLRALTSKFVLFGAFRW